MRRLPAWIFAVMGVCVLAPSRATADDGFWVTLASGASGASSPTDSAEFYFDSPHAPIVINQLSGVSTGQASTGGGTTFFKGGGVPILLPTENGYATITPSGSTPAGSLPRFESGSLATGAPQPGFTPSGQNLLSLGMSEPGANGSKVLSVGVTDSNGNPLGQGQVTVPTDGWWVIGLGTAALDEQAPPPIIPQPPRQELPPPPPPPITTGGSVTTPEPASVFLLGVGGLTAAGVRRIRRR